MSILTHPTRRTAALLAVALLAVLTGGRVGAQDRGGANTPREPEVCVGAGTALAVLSPGSAIADVITPRTTSRGATVGSAAGPTKIVLTKPGLVGACADFRGYWTDGASGAEDATLRLMAVGADGAETEVAIQNVADTRTGPALRDARLRAATRVEAPGPSRFVAVLTVSATPDGGAPAVRTVRLPIDVDLRLPGAIEGRVLGADGQPLAGALVRAQQIAVARPLGLPFDPPSTDAALQADRGQNAGGAATDADGRYRLPVMPGNWAVRVDAARHKVQWFEGAAAQRDAKPVTVAAGATVASIDFQLVAADPTPTPVPMAAVSGIVRGADGLPLEGAVVRAIRAANSTIGDRSSTGAGGTRTGADGSYVLKVPVGAWLVAAEADGHVRQYWDHQVESRTATVVTLALDEVRPGIDFDLAHKPQATIRGTVLQADGTAAAGARVMAVRRDGPTDRNGQLPTTGPKVETNAQGEFVLSVEPGTYAVGASPKADRSSTPPVWRWWDGKGAIADADLLALADGAVREGVRIGLQ
ncbi:MAG: carboxypeptidase regulatory-like domain-containing protein [Ardenticatenales bacterium]|nr:carboxypeptidase regulatory-like domain-containing protein [Ardenticatenales bacterium]